MTKALLIILGLILVFVVFGLIRSSSLKSIRIERDVTIKRPLPEVFKMVQYLNEFPKWSPFLAQDPGQKFEVKGTDGAVGAQYHWNGNGGKDLGYQEIVNIEQDRFIGLKCDIQKPFVAQPTFEYSFSQTAEGVVVKQDFKLTSATVDALFLWLFGAKKEMEKTNEQGLQLLKAALEKQ
jgi:Polyketide cyclase / dehydrase and lipid transport